MQLGVLEYLIRADSSHIQSDINSADSKIRKFGDKLSAWTVAKGQMIGRFGERMISSTANMMKNTVKNAVSAFGQFEQIEGGAKLVWGNTFSFIEKRAKQAYKNVQMSATEYMEQANYFAVGLKTALNGDTDAAAELADSIITAQADIVAALGIDAERVQNAFNGIMRGNYTMLDNLGMGIAGTKAGMQEVIKQVNEWNKAQGKQTKYSMKSIADQQKALVDYVKMQGFAGYAAAEGADTLEGSIASAKAAWQDLLTAMGRGRDVKQATKNFGDAVKKTFKNIKPVFVQTIKGVFTTIKEILPEVGDMFKTLVVDLKESDSPFLQSLGKGLEFLHTLLTGAIGLITDFDGTVDKMKKSDSPLTRLFGEGLEKIKVIADTAVTALTEGIPAAIEKLSGMDDPLANLLSGGLQLLYDVCQFFFGNASLESIIAGIANAFLLFKSITITKSFLDFLGMFNKKGLPIGGGGNGGSPTGGGWLSNTKNKIFSKAKSGVKALAKVMPFAAPFLLFADGIIHDQQMVNEAYEKGEQSIAATKAKRKIFAGNPMYDTWDALNGFVNVSGNSDSGNANMDKFAEHYVQWFNSEIEDKALDKLTELMTDQQFDDFHDAMIKRYNELINGSGEEMYSDAERDKYLNALKDAVSLLEDEMEKNPVEIPTELKPDLAGLQEMLNGSSVSVPTSMKRIRGDIDSNANIWEGFGQAKGNWMVPYDNYPSLLHRGEIVLNKSQARQFRNEGNGISIGTDIGREIREAMGKINVLLSGEKVGDLTTKRIKRNINASSYSKLRAMGG